MSLTEGERERLNALSRGNVTYLDAEAREVFDELVDDAILGLAFEVHRTVKTGAYLLGELDELEGSKNSAGSSIATIGQDGQLGSNVCSLDVFGQTVSTTSGVPALKKQCECICPNCQRNLAASRFAPHLEKCMGMGRNSSRIASRRLAKGSNESGNYREDLDEVDNAEDEDWIEPGSRSHHGSSSSSRRKRDKNSPRRNRARQTPGSLSSTSNSSRSGDNYSSVGELHKGMNVISASVQEDRDRVYTPPSGYDQLTLEERSNLLAKICGVVSASQHHKICTRSTKCPVHTDTQRREVRLRWLSNEEESHVDIDSFTEGDTATLRESLAQLSNASSPAESTISTSSNPSANSSIRGGGGSGGRRSEKSRRGNKKGSNKAGSKNGSRGSTPPLPFE